MSTFIKNTQERGFIQRTIDRIQTVEGNWRKFTSSPDGKTACAFVALGSIALIAASFLLPPVGGVILLAALKVILVALILLILAMLSSDEDPVGEETEQHYLDLTEDTFADNMNSVQLTPPALEQH